MAAQEPSNSGTQELRGGTVAVVDTGGLRKGLTIELDNELVRIVEYQHI